jgi:uncharacterized protein YggU (UPF0235/DUF167 family)
VKSNARRNGVEVLRNGGLKVNVAVAPIDGKANAKLIELLAAHFKVPKSRVRIRHGAKSPTKLIDISP